MAYGKPLSKRCAAVSCGTGIPTSMLMCRRHWGMVPAAIQEEVYDKLEAWQNGAPVAPYVLAARRAALAVAIRESKLTPAVDRIKAEIARLEARA